MFQRSRAIPSHRELVQHLSDPPDRRAHSILTALEQQIMDAIKAGDEETLDKLEKALEGKRFRTKAVII